MKKFKTISTISIMESLELLDKLKTMNTKLTIAETIIKLEAGFGSIFSKDDVLLMLNNIILDIEQSKSIITKSDLILNNIELNNAEVKSTITKSDLRKLKNNIVENIIKNREDICTIDDIELSINYHKSIEIDDINFNESELESLVADCVDDFINLHNINESEEESKEESEEESEE